MKAKRPRSRSRKHVAVGLPPALEKELAEGRIPHGGMVRVPARVLNTDEADAYFRRFRQHFEEGMEALKNHTSKFAADVDLPPEAQLQALDFFDVDTGDLVFVWRVMCQQIVRH